jgi:hypothetical protein
LYFRKPDGSLASFKDVQHDWNYYQQQLPADYIHEYSYADVRYTNWTKIPVLSPAVKKIFDATLGKQQTNDLSLRVFFIRKFRILYYFALAFYLYSWYKIVNRYARKRTAAKSSVPAKMDTGNQRVYKRA